jgi:hypothetical protein
MKIDFQHKQSAHCENGVTSNLMNFYGIKLSEPMIFGIASGLFFSYMPFVKLNGLPVVSFRPWPGMIFKRFTKRLNIGIHHRKFSDKMEAMEKLDEMIQNGIPTGLLVGVFNLSYFPAEYRFHFNAHNVVVFGKEDNHYLISDPVMENVETLSYDELLKVRFAQGTYPPKGRLYYVTGIPDNFDLSHAIIKGIKKNCNDMLTIPVPLFGVNGIRYLAKRVKNWDKKLGEKKASLYLGQVIRMLEEIGTGGAGFRFIYAAFLQEAAGVLNKPDLIELSKQMTAAGDKWREFASLSAKNLKARRSEKTSYSLLSDVLFDIADKEENIFRQLNAMNYEL